MTKRNRIFILIMALISFSSELVYARDISHSIHFEPKQNTKQISGAVIRGDRDVYLLQANANQQMTVKITSLENNAVFYIQSPKGVELKKAAEIDDATNWVGILPVTGKYKIVVGGTRGNASYKLSIKIV